MTVKIFLCISDLIKKLPLFHSDVRIRGFQIFSLMAIGAGLVLPADGLNVSICLFYNITKIPCPSCGLTRSVIHIMHADISHSVMFHPLGLIAVPVFLTGILTVFFRFPLEIYFRYENAINKIFITVGILTVIFGVIRALLIVYHHDVSILYFHEFNEKTVYEAVKSYL